MQLLRHKIIYYSFVRLTDRAFAAEDSEVTTAVSMSDNDFGRTTSASLVSNQICNLAHIMEGRLTPRGACTQAGDKDRGC